MNSIIDKNNPLKMKISRTRDLKRKPAAILTSPVPVKKRRSIRVTISSIRSKPVIKSTDSESGCTSKAHAKPEDKKYEKMVKRTTNDEYNSKWLLGLARHLKNKINPTQNDRADACLEMMKDGFVINETKHSVEFLSYLKTQFVRQVTGINDNTYNSLKKLLLMTRTISIMEINQLLNDNSCVHWSETHFEADECSVLDDF